jgi:hypothetical protein
MNIGIHIIWNTFIIVLEGKKDDEHRDIVVTYEIRVFFEGAQKEVFSSIFLKTL